LASAKNHENFSSQKKRLKRPKREAVISLESSCRDSAHACGKPADSLSLRHSGLQYDFDVHPDQHQSSIVDSFDISWFFEISLSSSTPRRRKVLGARLRTRLVVAFVALSLLPTTILFFFSINFITNSIEFWFNVPVEQALEKSLLVGQQFYRENEIRHQFFLERISYQIYRKRILTRSKRKELNHYIQVVQREFDLDTLEIYSANLKRLTYALSEDLEKLPGCSPSWCIRQGCRQ
jgi:hypothetical protein